MIVGANEKKVGQEFPMRIADMAKHISDDPRVGQEVGDRLIDGLNIILDQGMDGIAAESLRIARSLGGAAHKVLMDCYQMVAEMTVRGIAPLGIPESHKGEAYAYQLVAIALIGDFGHCESADGGLVADITQNSGLLSEGAASLFGDTLFLPGTLMDLGFSGAKKLTRELSGQMINGVRSGTMAELATRNRRHSQGRDGEGGRLRFLVGMNALPVERGLQIKDSSLSDLEIENVSRAIEDCVARSAEMAEVSLLGQDTLFRCVRVGVEGVLNQDFRNQCRKHASIGTLVTWAPESYPEFIDLAGSPETHSALIEARESAVIGFVANKRLVGLARRKIAPWEFVGAVNEVMRQVLDEQGFAVEKRVVH